MKRFILILLCVACCVPFAFAGGKKLVIGVTPFPHKDLMLVAQKELAKDGYELEIREFTDYVQPNMALHSGALDANFFQHIPYLENMNKQENLALTWIAKVHIEPLGLYSKKIKNIKDLKKGDRLAVPNDPTNEARALRLLEKHKVIQIKPGELVTVQDITANPLNLEILELEAAQLPRVLQDVTAAVINTNFAAEADLVPARDAIVIEGKDSPYANVIAVRKADVDIPAIKALAKACNSPAVKEYIEKHLLEKGIVSGF